MLTLFSSIQGRIPPKTGVQYFQRKETMRKIRLFVPLSIVVVFLAAAGMASQPSASALAPATLVATSVGGQVLVVTKLDDTDDGSCDEKDCSLREAIKAAPDGTTITFQPGLSGTIGLQRRPDQDRYVFEIYKSLTINGPESGQITLDGQQTVGMFIVIQR